MKTASQIFKEAIETSEISKEEHEILLSNLSKYMSNVDDSWNYVTPQELHDEHELTEFFILDTRDKDAFDAGHIEGATNIFWLDLLKAENLAKLPKDKTILLVCFVGHTASQMLVVLRLLGYDVIVLKFGMGISPVKGVPVAGWLNYGYETVK